MNMPIMQEKNFLFPAYLVYIVQKYTLNTSDFILLIYFWNYPEQTFDITLISQKTHLSEEDILNSFNTLICKKLIKLDTKKNSNGQVIDSINLDNLYVLIDELFQKETKEKEKKDIYSVFEEEFGRPFSSYEYEIINGWQQKNIPEELILGALKEAVYNGVVKFNYIDRILNEWSKKGYKNMKEVNNHNFKPSNKEPAELFDYNWLDDNEN